MAPKDPSQLIVVAMVNAMLHLYIEYNLIPLIIQSINQSSTLSL
jgi:hypothetical protein